MLGTNIGRVLQNSGCFSSFAQDDLIKYVIKGEEVDGDVRKTFSRRSSDTKNDHITKTDSGQTDTHSIGVNLLYSLSQCIAIRWLLDIH